MECGGTTSRFYVGTTLKDYIIIVFNSKCWLLSMQEDGVLLNALKAKHVEESDFES